MNASERADLLEKVEKLRRLAAGTPYPEEANTASEMADAIIKKYNLDPQTASILKEIIVNDIEEFVNDIKVGRGWMYWKAGGLSMTIVPPFAQENLFNAWVGWMCSRDPAFWSKWANMSKDERRKWREEHWKYDPKRLSDGE